MTFVAHCTTTVRFTLAAKSVELITMVPGLITRVKWQSNGTFARTRQDIEFTQGELTIGLQSRNMPRDDVRMGSSLFEPVLVGRQPAGRGGAERAEEGVRLDSDLLQRRGLVRAARRGGRRLDWPAPRRTGPLNRNALYVRQSQSASAPRLFPTWQRLAAVVDKGIVASRLRCWYADKMA